MQTAGLQCISFLRTETEGMRTDDIFDHIYDETATNESVNIIICPLTQQKNVRSVPPQGIVSRECLKHYPQKTAGNNNTLLLSTG